jgi:hypothetical protein
MPVMESDNPHRRPIDDHIGEDVIRKLVFGF